MFSKRPLALVIGLALLSLELGVAGPASGALIGQPANSPFQAIYGSPGTNKLAIPVGGGLGRNFGFGENMLFEASTEKKIGKNFEITLGEKEKEKEKSTSEDVYIGGTLQSNKTGENNPLGFAIQFADFQDSTFGVKNPQSTTLIQTIGRGSRTSAHRERLNAMWIRVSKSVQDPT